MVARRTPARLPEQRAGRALRDLLDRRRREGAERAHELRPRHDPAVVVARRQAARLLARRGDLDDRRRRSRKAADVRSERLLPGLETRSAGETLEALDELVERLAIRTGAPFLGRAPLGSRLERRIAEAEHDRDLLAVAEPEELCRPRGVRHPVRARADTLVPRREHHVLSAPADVE